MVSNSLDLHRPFTTVEESLLFNIFVNDYPNATSKFKVIMYA